MSSAIRSAVGAVAFDRVSSSAIRSSVGAVAGSFLPASLAVRSSVGASAWEGGTTCAFGSAWRVDGGVIVGDRSSLSALGIVARGADHVACDEADSQAVSVAHSAVARLADEEPP